MSLKLKCAACGSDGGGGLISCRDCGRPLVFDEAYVRRAEAAYRDERMPERACERCGALYRGPAVYCSLACAIADA